MCLFQVLVSSGSTIIFLYSVETNRPADDVSGASQVAQVNLCEGSGASTRFTAVHVKFSYGNISATITVSDARPHASDFSSEVILEAVLEQ